tara:strand:+ start:548 stop:1051 length:504 start_codon:yes stop_codon:yes gene_type:complete
MMNRIFCFSFVVCLLFIQATIHPYYVSTLEIDYRPDRAALQITMRVFTDDWQLMLNTHYDKSLRLDPDTDEEQIVIHSTDYLKQYLELKLNGTDVTPSVLGREYKDDQLVLYLEVMGVAELQTLGVSNRILFAELEGQQNIIRIKTPAKRKSFLQSQGRARDVFRVI